MMRSTPPSDRAYTPSDKVFRLPADSSPDPLDGVRASSDELVQILLQDGATLVGRHEHGVFLRARNRLIFVHRRSVLDHAELLDSLEAAGVAVGGFLESLRQLLKTG
jgi:hypothetical protein